MKERLQLASLGTSLARGMISDFLERRDRMLQLGISSFLYSSIVAVAHNFIDVALSINL